MIRRTAWTALVLFFTRLGWSQQNPYPQNYFRHPLNIPMQLVANFGEIRANHWHMGLDIRTQQRVNLPVYAAADGYIARVSVEPGGFGQAIYINHPNGYTTLYGHLNAFFPELSRYVQQQQYDRQSWRINLEFTPDQFPVRQGDLIALSGSTGASEGPHVHFEIRDTKTENCLNPLLFRFPLPDAVPPTLTRLALYDRNRSTYDQSPQVLALRKTGPIYSIPSGLLRTGSDKISFAIGAVDRFSGTNNPNGIYSATISLDGQFVSGFALDDISYNDTRYINAQLDYPYKSRGGGSLQHLTPLPGATRVAYHLGSPDGALHLTDTQPHDVEIEVRDANGNTSSVRFRVVYDPSLAPKPAGAEGERFLPNNLNVFERSGFELYTTEQTIYDTVTLRYAEEEGAGAGARSPLYRFLSASIPVHDSVTVRIRPAEGGAAAGEKLVIRNVSGERTYVQRAEWQSGWASARFRQFGTYQLLADSEAPELNAPPASVQAGSRIVFTPRDNLNTIRSFRAELDGAWLRFTNDKGRSWVYTVDDHFPTGAHELKVTVEDEAGNVTERTWTVRR